jgi:plastocyanin
MRTRVFPVVLALSLIALAGCSSGSGTAEKASGTAVRTNRVDLPKSYRFSPAVIEVSAGTTVTWTNDDNFVHNVHLLDGSDVTKDLRIGGSTSMTFTQPGSIDYQCSLHPQQMKGRVVVTE